MAVLVALPKALDRSRELRLDRATASVRHRRIVARLSGAEYAPYREAHGSETNLIVLGAASLILQRSENARLRGKALLLSGDSPSAVSELTRAIDDGDATALSDLSAALVAESDELDDVELALDALVVARRALVADPNFAAAQFNLGLALERIGLLAEACNAYDRAARLALQDLWGREAATRAAAFRTRNRPTWKSTEALLASSTDHAQRKALVLADVGAARAHAEGPYLANWASARIEGNAEEARRNLELARRIGEALQDASGDRLALDAVAAIARAEARGNDSPLEAARAHLLYRDGRRARSDRDEEKAIEYLTAAASALQRLDSPLQYSARYYISGALFEEGRFAEALTTLDALASDLAAKPYLGLTAQLAWERGICLNARGESAEALDGFERSRKISERIHDRDLAARFDGLAAEALDSLGQSRIAWQRRARAIRSYEVLGAKDAREYVALSAAARAQIGAQKWERACALLHYAILLAVKAGDPLVACYALTQRSICRDELGDAEGAASDRGEARRWLAKIAAGGSGQRLRTELDIAEGIAERKVSPRQAIERFSRAINDVRARRENISLPRLFFERARAFAMVGERARAIEDLHAGLAVVREWERSTATAEQRAAIGVWSDAIRRDLIALELDAGDVSGALASAEDRYSAASFQEPARPIISLGTIRSLLADDAAIVELATSRKGLVVFIIRRDAAHAVALRDDARIHAAADAMRAGDDEAFNAAARTLYELLFAPIAAHLEGIQTVVVVPTPDLAGVPFGALHDEVRKLDVIDEMRIVHAPTATAAIRWSQRLRETGSNTLLAIGASRFDRSRYADANPLQAVEREARRVAALAKGERLIGTGATPDTITRALAGAGVVHYAGHIVGRGGDARFLLSSANGRDTLSSREVAALTLDKTNVVVLAGCRGTGASAPHAVVADMASGFLAAGVPAVIASASDIDDGAATPTMLQVHEMLLQGHDAAEAVRRVTISARKDDPSRLLALRLLVIGGARSLLR